MIELFQIYYKDEQKQDLVDGFIPYYNKKKSIFVESECMYDIRHNNLAENASHVGVFSYKFNSKLLKPKTFESICKAINSASQGDIFSPYPKSWGFKYLHSIRQLCFPNQMNMRNDAMPFLNDLADLNIFSKPLAKLWHRPNHYIWCNFWVAKKEIFIDYVDNFLNKIFELINSYDKNHVIFKIDSEYPCTPPKDWQESTGFSNYPMITFILERLINIYVHDRNLNHQLIL